MKLQTPIMAAVLATALMTSGCSQFSEMTKGYWVDGEAVSLMVANSDAYQSPVYTQPDTVKLNTTRTASLRAAPAQSINFADGDYQVEIYDAPTPDATDYAGYSVELYDTAPASLRTGPAASYAMITDPRDTGFVKLNGDGAQSDWQNCETTHRGYLYASEGDFRLNPDFEVCMRNKGYVLSSEAGPALSAMAIRATSSSKIMAAPISAYPTASYP